LKIFTKFSYYVKLKSKAAILISGFHRALLQSITFISRLKVLNYKKPRG